MNSLLSKVERNVKYAVNELLEKNIRITSENIIHLTYINEDNALENERKIASGKIIVNEDGGAFASHDEFVDFIIESQGPKFDDIKKSMGLYRKQSLIKYHPEPYINTHALYKKEFDWFYRFKFDDPKLERARDMFILQTWLGGLRQVDFYKLTKDDFHKDSDGSYRVVFEQQKTDGDVINKINQNYLIPIFEKYSGGFPEFFEVHNYNDLLKQSAFKAGLNRKLRFRYEYANADDATEERVEIHKKISNSWARNCAVSILCELGYPDYRIAKFTGHKDLEMINHYKKIHPKEVDSMIDEVGPEFVNEL